MFKTKSNVDACLSRVGFAPIHLAEVEQLHEVTKLHPFQDRVFGQRINDYLTSERAAVETAANYKSYSELVSIDLPEPADATMNFQELLSRRHSTRQYAAKDLSLRESKAYHCALHTTIRWSTSWK